MSRTFLSHPHTPNFRANELYNFNLELILPELCVIHQNYRELEENKEENKYHRNYVPK